MHKYLIYLALLTSLSACKARRTLYKLEAIGNVVPSELKANFDPEDVSLSMFKICRDKSKYVCGSAVLITDTGIVVSAAHSISKNARLHLRESGKKSIPINEFLVASRQIDLQGRPVNVTPFGLDMLWASLPSEEFSNVNDYTDKNREYPNYSDFAILKVRSANISDLSKISVPISISEDMPDSTLNEQVFLSHFEHPAFRLSYLKNIQNERDIYINKNPNQSLFDTRSVIPSNFQLQFKTGVLSLYNSRFIWESEDSRHSDLGRSKEEKNLLKSFNLGLSARTGSSGGALLNSEGHLIGNVSLGGRFDIEETGSQSEPQVFGSTFGNTKDAFLKILKEKNIKIQGMSVAQRKKIISEREPVINNFITKLSRETQAKKLESYKYLNSIKKTTFRIKDTRFERKDKSSFSAHCLDFSIAKNKQFFRISDIEVKLEDPNWVKVRYYTPKRESSLDDGKWFWQKGGWSPYFKVRSEHFLTNTRFLSNIEFTTKSGVRLEGFLPLLLSDKEKLHRHYDQMPLMKDLLENLILGAVPEESGSSADIEDRRLYRCK